MLLQLDIKNYAIIQSVSVSFSDNLNVITGETGAGKSILLGALSLILGVRAGKGTLKDKKNKAIIEGTFSLPQQEEIKQFFTTHELDYAEETILRREINPSGKSRAFINDTPVNLKQLATFATFLVDLHQQFDTLQLGQSQYQLRLLDLLAGHKKEIESYQQEFKKYTAYKTQYQSLTAQVAENTKERDYLQFLLEELEEADFKKEELEELTQELHVQNNTEALKQNLNDATHLLEDNEFAVISQLRMIQNQLSSLSDYHKALPDIMERLSSSQIELQDLSSELEQINETIEYDEERISFIQDRLNIGNKLLKKHQLQTTEDLLNLQASIKEKLNQVAHLDNEIEEVKEKSEKQLKKVQKLATTLSHNREKQIAPFVTDLEALLKQVGMPNARIKVKLTTAELSDSGQDEISFGFDANKSGEFLPINKVASGGELSRLMLCIKSQIAHAATLPTLIFDEIESGISGEAAKQVGILLGELAQKHQVICISHQPLVAAKATTHFQVVKSEKQGVVSSEIHPLTKKERIRIIAGMLSGNQPTEAALTNAKEMIK